MPFVKGQPKPSTSGRKRGTANRITTSMREAYALAFEGLGGVDALIRWGRRNPGRFYPLAARLIPHDIARPLAALPTAVRVELVEPPRSTELDTLKERGKAA